MVFSLPERGDPARAPKTRRPTRFPIPDQSLQPLFADERHDQMNMVIHYDHSMEGEALSVGMSEDVEYFISLFRHQ